MNQINTGSKQIFRFDNVLSLHTCEMLCSFLLDNKGAHETSNNNSQELPWKENDTFNFLDIADPTIREKVIIHRYFVKNLVTINFKKTVFIDFTDMVLWRKGKFQDRHIDSGYVTGDPLNRREYTAITYLNDRSGPLVGFEGGSTFIKTENGDDYVCQPKAGSVVIFHSDDRAEHGVNEVTSGIRMTLPIWFSSDYSSSEELRHHKLLIEQG